MKVYVINLEKNRERFVKISDRLKELGVDFERVPAVYGRDLSDVEKHKAVSYFKWWCVRGTFPRDGEIGCALSHLSVYRELIKSGDDCCCVLEDDDQLDGRFKEQLSRIERWIRPGRPQVVLMTNYTREQGGDDWRIVPSSGDSSTEAYVITREGACSLLKHNSPACMPSDGWRFWVKRGWIELYHAFPTIVPSTWQLPGYTSDVCPKGEKMVRVSEMNCVKRIVWKLERLFGVILARVLVR